ncbi:dTDP-rhamnosyl transferase RfbF [Nitrosomonas sp. PY1]|uniref:glycosyltransferase family 2 protein n=1 Tax=Nitrosomonas sp. PY1 TaxID=1803906 RepID=UPI001FC8EB3D|nr:glycosyltransferase family 2 protein [Nitrosomonas sp. PY1]GKS68189.1 dTDP-rhamnosyl transferase RfbF [Nitrosomonas sp. PY1]
MNTLYIDIIPIIVTYNPDDCTLCSTIKTLASQVETIVIVDNASNTSIESSLHTLTETEINKVKLLALKQNYGLGAAYNHGIALALQLKAKFVLLLDHDSIPQHDMLERLHNAFISLEKEGKLIAAVGPRYYSPGTTNISEFIRITSKGLERVTCAHSYEYVHVSFLISSGSLISLNALNIIGNMDETLFIDHIDTEWCLRAQSKGFEIYGICNAMMFHTLGDRQIRVWWKRWRSISCHQPFRYYYMFRNSVLLWRRTNIPKTWKNADRLRIFYLLFFFSIFSPNRVVNLKMMIKGITHGLRGISGKL